MHEHVVQGEDRGKLLMLQQLMRSAERAFQTEVNRMARDRGLDLQAVAFDAERLVFVVKQQDEDNGN